MCVHGTVKCITSYVSPMTGTRAAGCLKLSSTCVRRWMVDSAGQLLLFFVVVVLRPSSSPCSRGTKTKSGTEVKKYHGSTGACGLVRWYVPVPRIGAEVNRCTPACSAVVLLAPAPTTAGPVSCSLCVYCSSKCCFSERKTCKTQHQQ